MRIAPVYELIQTLSAAEMKLLKKRSDSKLSAFKILLHIMHGAEQNNEQLFRQLFAKECVGVDYSETKSYLYKFILRHLTENQHSHHPFTKITFQLTTAEMLNARGLHQEAFNVFKQASDAAGDEGYHQLNIVAIRRMKNLLLQTGSSEKSYPQVYALHRIEQRERENDRIVSECFLLYSRFLQLIEKYGGPINNNVAAQMRAIATNSLLKNYQRHASKHARLICFDLITNYYLLTNQRSQLTLIYKQELKTMESEALSNPYYAYRYLYMLHNLLGLLSNLAERKRYVKLLNHAPTPDLYCRMHKECFSLHAQIDDEQKSDQSFVLVLKQAQKFATNDWVTARPLEQTNLLLHLLQQTTHRQLFAESEDLCRTALQRKSNEDMLPAQFVAIRLFLLAALVEQRKFGEMETHIRALQYALRTKELGNAFTKTLLQLFLKLMRGAPREKLTPLLIQLQKAQSSMPYFRYVQFGLSDFIASGWITSMVGEKRLIMKNPPLLSRRRA